MPFRRAESTKPSRHTNEERELSVFVSLFVLFVFGSVCHLMVLPYNHKTLF